MNPVKRAIRCRPGHVDIESRLQGLSDLDKAYLQIRLAHNNNRAGLYAAAANNIATATIYTRRAR